MQKGHHVTHNQTGRAGRISSFNNTLPTTITVAWNSSDTVSSHEASELDLSRCNREHSMYQGLFCALSQNHEGWCCCN